MTMLLDAPPRVPGPLERLVDRIPFLEKELFLLRRLVRPGDVCLDVGAAGGAHLLVMARRVGRTGRVLGVEARPGSARVLSAIAGIAAGRARVEIHQVALAADTGWLTLRVPLVPTRAHLLGSSDRRDAAAAFPGLPAARIDVPTRRLDDVVRLAGLTRIDVLKCDVEGAEGEVLAGAASVLAHHRPVVLLEADDLHQARYDRCAADVVGTVVDAGYRPFRYVRGRLERLAGVVDGEDDYVLVPEERIGMVTARVGVHPG
ncbi:MAG: FkbM family methyltransferase [Nitriliruptoraceae bacterium]|nr:FkbM family methyltransferase [Nitriliruptoraceae bacterium]